MRLLLATIAMIPGIALTAAAQDSTADQIKVQVEKLMAESKMIGIRGAVMGATVKNAPYSAVEVNESNQVLADGTRIHNETETKVFRDSEGRVRRETADQVTIMDPVAGVSYLIDPKAQTARKIGLSMPVVYKDGVFSGEVGAGGQMTSFEMHSTQDGVTSVTVNGKPVDPSTVTTGKMVMLESGDAQFAADAMKKHLADAMELNGAAVKTLKRSLAPSESLGKQAIEGVMSDGTRSVRTLEAGSIGNDRPIQIVNERWYSSELQTVTMTRHSDPRSGEETFRLSNVNRNEPPSYLFQVPPGYQLLERK